MEMNFGKTEQSQQDQALIAYPERKKFLVVEDDITIQPLWERIIKSMDSKAMIRWSSTEEGAEKLIQDRQRIGDSFDFIIADIMLAGKKTGIDLWKQYGNGDSVFLFASNLSPKKFAEMIGDRDDRYPFLVRKPLNSLECLECLRAMLAYKRAFSGLNS